MRSGVEIGTSVVVGKLVCGEICEAFERRFTDNGTMVWYKVASGWIREFTDIEYESSNRISEVLKEENRRYGNPYATVIGMGYDSSNQNIYFTRNGILMSTMKFKTNRSVLQYPAVGFISVNGSIRLNLGKIRT